MAFIRTIKILFISFITILSVFVVFEYKTRRSKVYGYESATKAESVLTGTKTSHNVPEAKVVNTDPLNARSEIQFTPAAVAKRFHQRLDHLQQECKQKYYQPPSDEWIKNGNFLVDLPRRLLVCAVAKSGSTTWHRTIWALRQKRNGKSTDQSLYTPNDTLHNTYLANSISRADGSRLIHPVVGDTNFWQDPPPDSSFRLILARHPFARLISGWNQKFMLKSNTWVQFFKTYRDLLNYRKSYDETHVMAFRDFAQYVAEKGLNLKALDYHFVPAHVFCRPCSYHYTYILKAESVDIDESWLMKRLNLTDLDIGHRGSPPGGSVVNDDVKGNIKKYMSQLRLPVMRQLYKVYEKDFNFFGYTFNFTTLEAGGFE